MLYSIKMRSAKGGDHKKGGYHISGAEKIIKEEDIEKYALKLIKRAFNHSKGKADFINLKIEKINEEIIYISPLKIKSYTAENYLDGRNFAKEFLHKAKVSPIAIENAFRIMENMEKNIRGSILIHYLSGKRLDFDKDRGLRVSKMDYEDKDTTFKDFDEKLKNNEHFIEALALASKVQSSKYVVAELCFSDDPHYIAGYVSGKGIYHRISKMKQLNSTMGCRVFFINTEDEEEIKELYDYLENQSVLIK